MSGAHLCIEESHLKEGLFNECSHPTGVWWDAKPGEGPCRVGQRLGCKARELKAGCGEQSRDEGIFPKWRLQPQLPNSVQRVGKDLERTLQRQRRTGLFSVHGISSAQVVAKASQYGCFSRLHTWGDASGAKEMMRLWTRVTQAANTFWPFPSRPSLQLPCSKKSSGVLLPNCDREYRSVESCGVVKSVGRRPKVAPAKLSSQREGRSGWKCARPHSRLHSPCAVKLLLDRASGSQAERKADLNSWPMMTRTADQIG